MWINKKKLDIELMIKITKSLFGSEAGSSFGLFGWRRKNLFRIKQDESMPLQIITLNKKCT